MTTKLKAITKEDWRQLGYYYNRDDISKSWILEGSPYGLQSFVFQLNEYSSKIENRKQSEHIHIGPYDYLKIMTSDKPGVSKDSIFGSHADIEQLAISIENQLIDNNINKTITIDDYSPESEYKIELRIKEYGFDPSNSDTQLWE